MFSQKMETGPLTRLHLMHRVISILVCVLGLFGIEFILVAHWGKYILFLRKGFVHRTQLKSGERWGGRIKGTLHGIHNSYEVAYRRKQA